MHGHIKISQKFDHSQAHWHYTLPHSIKVEVTINVTPLGLALTKVVLFIVDKFATLNCDLRIKVFSGNKSRPKKLCLHEDGYTEC